MRGIDINPDGTKIARADTYGAYIYNSVSGRWDQLVTTARMPGTAFANLVVDGTGGVYAACAAPSNSSRIYLTYLNQVYRSDDKGASFTLTGFSALSMSSNNGVAQYGPKMAVDPANPDVCILVTDSGGAWLTINAGVSWSKISGVANNGTAGLCAVAFDGSSGTTSGKTNTVYIAVSGTGVYRSTATASGSFSLLTSTPTNPSRIKVASDGVVYVTQSDQAKLWKLTGTTWADITSSTLVGQGIDNVLLDPSNAAHITAFSPAGYFDDSTNRGGSYTGVNFAKTRVTTDIPYLGTLFESITGGSQSSFFFGIGDLLTDPNTGTTWMTGGQAVFTTGTIQPAANQAWTSNAAGIEQLVANQMLSPPGLSPLVISWDTAVLISASPTSFPTAQRWDTAREINRGSAADYAKNNSSFVAAIVNQVAEESGSSTDGGVTWTKFPTAATTGNGGSIAVATSTNMVWAPNNNGDLFNTKDGGTTWTKRTPSGVPTSPSETGWGNNAGNKQFVVTADCVNVGTFYAYNYGPTGASAAKGVYKSTDGGDTWTHVFTNWLTNISSSGDNSFNTKLRAVPGQAGVLFFTGGQQGVNGDPVPHTQSFWKSTDAGATWSAVASVLEVWDFGFGAAASGSPNPTLYIYGWVGSVGGVWRSTDLGSTWAQIGGLYPTTWVDTLACICGDMNSYGTVYVGFDGSGYGYGSLQ